MFLVRNFKPFLKLYLFWLAFFFAGRTIFLFYFNDELANVEPSEVLSTFLHAIYLDTSMVSYFLAFSFIILLPLGLLPAGDTMMRRWLERIHGGYMVLLLIICTLILIGELEIYHEWGTKLTVKALRFLEHPAEVLGSTKTGFLVMGFAAVGLIVWLFYRFYKNIDPFSNLREEEYPLGRRVVSGLLFFITAPVMIVLGLRGGWQQIPIQQSDAYFSKHNILNLAAVNSIWNLGQSIWENKKNMEGNPYVFYPPEQAGPVLTELFGNPSDSSVSILRTARPNIVLVILESFSGDMVKSLGGLDSCAVNLDVLGKEGLMFDSLFANASLSDQGMTAIFSGSPSLPSYISIIGQPSKYGKLPCLSRDLQEAGYRTSFLFGGQLSYGNIKAYMYYNRFDRILEGVDFSDDIPRGKLGVHDEFLYERQLQELRSEKQPFFAAMFTLSSHSPYDMPMKAEEKLNIGGDEKNYVNSVRYADQKLYEFIQKSKNEPWFANTLFIITADHSHRSPRHWTPEQPEYRRIPLLFWGPALKSEYQGKRVSKVCSQLDLSATLLAQLKMPYDRYKWSKDIFNSGSKGFAFYETYDGFGYVNGRDYLVYAHSTSSYPYTNIADSARLKRMEEEGKSFLQVMFQEYLDY